MVATTERLVLRVDKSKLSDFLTVLRLFDFVQVETAPEFDEYEDNLSENEIAQFHEVMEMPATSENFVSHEEVKTLVQEWLNRKR